MTQRYGLAQPYLGHDGVGDDVLDLRVAHRALAPVLHLLLAQLAAVDLRARARAPSITAGAGSAMQCCQSREHKKAGRRSGCWGARTASSSVAHHTAPASCVLDFF